MLKNVLDTYTKELNNWVDSKTKSFGLTEIFETEILEVNEIYDFLKNERNNIAAYVFCEYLNFQPADYCSIILANKNNINDNLNFYRLFIKCLCAYSIIDEKINNGGNYEINKLLVKNVDDYLNLKNGYYRGQANYEWGIIPSIYRKINISSMTDGIVFNKSYMYDLYDKKNLIMKYNSTIAINNITNYKMIDYNFISYMQHSVSFSPLLDITTKSEIGLQFALNTGSNIEQYDNIASSLFYITSDKNIIDKENEINDILNNLEIYIVKDKIIPGRLLRFSKNNGEIITLNFTNIDNIIKNLTPEYKIINIKTNDRMRYQHGKFILFHKCVLVKGKILFTLNKDLNIIQYKINPISKKTLRKILDDKYLHFDIRYLLNPYDFFNEER